MKIFLAGCEDFQFAYLTEIAGIKNTLFSYYHWINTAPADKTRVEALWERYPQEIICDSGLFTLMFGVGKGGNYDLEYMRDYTKKYIEYSKSFKCKNLTIVESDVHKLLGMDAVFELRKYFEDSDFKVLYVWHREEGIDGLYKMAEKYDYIAISVPELRILCKGNHRYQDAVKDLEHKIYKNVSRLPKIHLLGNTVMETMKTNISYSCDSTSWLSGGRYGRYMHYEHGRIVSRTLTSDEYLKTKRMLETLYPEQYRMLFEEFAHRSEKYLTYSISMYLSAYSYKLFQDYLDTKYQCMEEVSRGIKGQHSSAAGGSDQTQSVESKPTDGLHL